MSNKINLETVQNELMSLYEKVNEIESSYICAVESFEQKKLKILDFSIRDAIDKQIMRAAQENEIFAEMMKNVENLRRQRDFLYKKIEIMKTLAYTLKPKD